MSAAKLLLVFLISYSIYSGCGAGRCAVPRLPGGRARPRQAGQLLKFTCQPGYTLVGNRYAYCRAGRWDVSLPVCVKPGCSPVTVENSIKVPLHEGAWVYYFCLPGYRHDGPSVIYCNGRTWNGTAPNCIVAAAAAARQLGCDFDAGLCGWTQDELHDFDWKRWSGRTPSAFMFTGPSHDHTHGPTGSGSYVYVEATSRLENDTARLLSPVYHADLATKGCFSFFYHMFGKTIGGLRVYQKPTTVGLPEMLALGDAERRKYLLFELWGDQGDAWYGAVADLTNFRENFQIVIEGVRGVSFTSDIAVDDVALLQGEQCAAARARAPTPPPYDVESCSGRCEGPAEEGSGIVRRVGSCGCGAGCFADNDCCPDYFELCGFAVTDTSSEFSLANTSDIDAGRLPDKQPLVANTASTGDHPSTITTTTSTITVSTTKPTTVVTTTSTAATKTSTTAITTSTATTAVVPKRTAPAATTTVSTKAVANTTAARRFTVPLSTVTTSRSTTKRVTVLPNIRRTTITAAAVITKTARPTAQSTNTGYTAAIKRTQRPFPPRSAPYLRTQTKKDKDVSVAEGGSALHIGMAVLAVLVVCGVVCWVVMRARTARGSVMLALLRANATRDPEVRFLTSNVDE